MGFQLLKNTDTEALMKRFAQNNVNKQTDVSSSQALKYQF
jgi:hypothetical protein